MATNERFMAVPPAAVWDVLADAGTYGDWVVGSKRVRAADPAWPAPGSRFHHTLGVGPLSLDDHTESLEADPPSLLRLRAKARPLGTAQVTLELAPTGGGTFVRMTETPDGLASVLGINPLVHLLTMARNGASLRRLEKLVKGRPSG
ncbi:MAG TPA: SRPBCC family protein [Solirubrobacteraceae bacterium]|nr:SRPBCC family protein [Solirubrobacteraceae bacterium]